MKKSYQRFSILVILLVFLVFYLLKANSFKNLFLYYTELFFKNIFPANFPLFIISSLLIDYGLVDLLGFFLPNSSIIYIFVLSMFSGFPSGAKYSKDLYLKKKISKEEAQQVLLFTHFPNPLFILGSVSSILKSKTLAYKILFSIILSNLILLLFTKKKKENCFSSKEMIPSFSESLSSAIASSCRSIILIYGTSIFFYLLSVCITQYIVLPPLCYVLICGLFDLTQGVFSTTILSNNILRSYFILFFISFGSLSIHLQVKSILEDTIAYHYFFRGRIIGTIICFIIYTFLI